MNQTRIETLLPEVIRRGLIPGSPMTALIEAMAGMLSPAEDAIASLPERLAVYRTADSFVLLLAYFVDLDRLLSGEAQQPENASSLAYAGGIGRLRELIRAAPMLARRRGTAEGLRNFLEIATGIVGFEIREGEDAGSANFHIAVAAPAQAKVYRELVMAIIEQEKPAYVTYDLRFGSERYSPV